MMETHEFILMYKQKPLHVHALPKNKNVSDCHSKIMIFKLIDISVKITFGFFPIKMKRNTNVFIHLSTCYCCMTYNGSFNNNSVKLMYNLIFIL